ncbi:hypothetical protein LI99_22395 [Mycolicibacterium smegmatis]|uniref:Uncharacterized protein n=1 Tax=Mycolicibacterium smegmatis (strain ATCC 700084 / mc(2)155) TaxID=246196 RepID=A0R0W0_MYCS2|nr:hypothetical protein MSMEG_4526 [Mycolicibacterium smegmatis MC2 155]AIU18532.1 hypothetical protein LI99_22395 [Mycolicibacterium smegmatis]AIU11907.1 hypothetical protein LJ00_22390 [Mycolicibacterium smegmatis MC2 155]AIU25154.1 hypothetical protein LI98_22400 [Mycolicibacterium smegmatis]TBH27007.1 hypothetical protein EYS45_31715 [Mycolicibacterium smegmatis MC2 155]
MRASQPFWLVPRKMSLWMLLREGAGVRIALITGGCPAAQIRAS